MAFVARHVPGWLDVRLAELVVRLAERALGKRERGSTMNYPDESYPVVNSIITEPGEWAQVNADGCPYNPYTPEARTWRVAQRNGRRAAGWVFDGNTSRETYQRVLAGLDEGDPAILDAYRTPDLSGEYADDYSEDDLMSDVGWVPNDGMAMRDDLAIQYVAEVDAAFWAEVERMARYMLEGDPFAGIPNADDSDNRPF